VDTILPGCKTAFMLFDVARLWRHAFEKDLAAHAIDLTLGNVRALTCVAQAGGCSQRRLADIMGIEPMTLSTALDALEEAGLIRRDANPADKRAYVIRTTPSGAAMLETVAPIAARACEKAMHGFDARQRQALHEVLTLVRENLLDSAPIPQFTAAA
jgi:MarR family transcriptional regulator, transcriptional regulator for hemolysin